MSPFQLAVTLIQQGFSIIPLSAKTKRPARKWKSYQTRFATTAELHEWFEEFDYQPAIVTGAISGITVVDCDSDQAVAAAESIGLSSEMTQRTPRGIHLVFAHNGERNTIRLAGLDGVDRRGEGGYVKAYPDSAHWTRVGVQDCNSMAEVSDVVEDDPVDVVLDPPAGSTAVFFRDGRLVMGTV